MEHHLVVVGPEKKRGTRGTTIAGHCAVLDLPSLVQRWSNKKGIQKRRLSFSQFLEEFKYVRQRRVFNFCKNSNM
jgi:hypothetical protein